MLGQALTEIWQTYRLPSDLRVWSNGSRIDSVFGIHNFTLPSSSSFNASVQTKPAGTDPLSGKNDFQNSLPGSGHSHRHSLRLGNPKHHLVHHWHSTHQHSGNCPVRQQANLTQEFGSRRAFGKQFTSTGRSVNESSYWSQLGYVEGLGNLGEYIIECIELGLNTDGFLCPVGTRMPGSNDVQTPLM
ncbi:unnamed protein product [Protopolystoma xenopodis]|uniref:Uncharacterized protein n=1 Tax=Protopolystoma xenopodis TaxID=117903 RepID=A0A448WKG3_9PLAT|nr:unnamed protein product [Protopolystoma xenopodis]